MELKNRLLSSFLQHKEYMVWLLVSNTLRLFLVYFIVGLMVIAFYYIN